MQEMWTCRGQVFGYHRSNLNKLIKYCKLIINISKCDFVSWLSIFFSNDLVGGERPPGEKPAQHGPQQAFRCFRHYEFNWSLTKLSKMHLKILQIWFLMMLDSLFTFSPWPEIFLFTPRHLHWGRSHWASAPIQQTFFHGQPYKEAAFWHQGIRNWFQKLNICDIWKIHFK